VYWKDTGLDEIKDGRYVSDTISILKGQEVPAPKRNRCAVSG
jgi:hypothetical protein